MVITEQTVKQLAARLAKQTSMPLNKIHTEIAIALGFKSWNALHAGFQDRPETTKVTGDGRDDIVAKLIATASHGYSDGLVQQCYDAQTDTVTKGLVGDTLAEFIAIEIKEVAGGETDLQTAAIQAAQAMETACRQLSDVQTELENIAEAGGAITLHECADTGDLWTETQLKHDIEDVSERVFPGEAMPSGESPVSLCVTHEKQFSDPAGVLARAAALADSFYKEGTRYAAIRIDKEKNITLEMFDAQAFRDAPAASAAVTADLPENSELITEIGKLVADLPQTREGHGPDQELEVGLFALECEFIQKRNDGEIVLIGDNDIVALKDLSIIEQVAVLQALRSAMRE